MSKQRKKKTNPKMAADLKAKAQRKADLIASYKGKFSKLPKATKR